MLKNRISTDYKKLAKKSEVRECLISDNAISELVVDVRSRLFMYIRTRYLNRPLKQKIDGLFRAMKNLEEERRQVFRDALAVAKMEVSFMRVNRAVYVFGSIAPCPYKMGLISEREGVTKDKLSKLLYLMHKFGSNMLDIQLLSGCIAALESYIISDLDGLCSVYRGMEHLLVPGARIANKMDMFESDRMCARLGKMSAVLSEDLDCLALFGANMMVKEVHRGFYLYTTLRDVMEAFGSTTRRELVDRCCILGTDYNFGIKGIGPVRIQEIDRQEARELCEACIKDQSVVPEDFWRFMLL